MAEQATLWPYPQVGMVAVMDTGARIAVWPWEDNCADTFSGQMLLEGRTQAQISVHDVSCMWSRAKVSKFEKPTEKDKTLSLYEL